MKNNFIDLTGERFGRLTVICRAENKYGKTNWKCMCDCGREKEVLGTNLKRGFTKSCGCYHNEEFGKTRFVDLTGRRFGMLVVLKRAENRGKEIFWLCQCDCGNTKETRGTRLKNGQTKSCGCLVRNPIHSFSHKSINVKHGKSNTRIYRIYNKMKLRCYSKNNSAYQSYGGRGITVCDEWLGGNGFQNFYDWSIQNGYSDNLTIDRINNNKGYFPDNCRWATRKEQANNTRSTIFLTYKGETKPASEWSVITGINQDILTKRKRNGWSDSECIETPIRERAENKKKNKQGGV